MSIMNIARIHIENAAAHHETMAAQCKALTSLLKAMRPADEEPMPIETLAKGLHPFGLCIVHRDALRNALVLVEQIDDAEGLSGDELRRLERSLNAAIHGSAA